ncbi:anti-sigma factor [Streptomyces tateyamensis]|uniref:Regulator of SigK n=1 Tax=Streptomyces tateyamensis TaxID=565073 RepID=A0A2V4PA10_9ACTN|nr:anti-sigma factor [Streptomyces tateyamensis]PYC87649.1 anti-sigma factor [Streptomyces tateyamensis]
MTDTVDTAAATADLHLLTGAYATDALDEPERGRFERHLAGCESCAEEVAEFAETLSRLGAAEAVAVPPELKRRVLAELVTVRQLAPEAHEDADSPVPTDRVPRRRGRAARQWPKLALAACLALAAGLGGLAVQQHDQAQQARARAARLEAQQAGFSALLTAPDARTATGTVRGGAVGTVVWSSARGQAGFLASGLPALGADRTYQLWFNDAGTMRPAGLLPGSGGSLLLQGPLDGAVGVGMTVEPAGGSAHPTSAPIMLLAFA